jgi:hypothetical protein
MKNFEKIGDGAWSKNNVPVLTEEQRALLASKDEADAEAKAEVNAYIASNMRVEATAEEVVILDATYEANKPELKENDTYSFIHCAMSLKDDKAMGLINCRINGEHTQVRF